MRSQFIGKLEEWRADLQMTNREFAAHLGISEGYWSRLRDGDRIGNYRAEKLIDRVLGERPELKFFLDADHEARRQQAVA
ncbi:MAG TPA: hypothetical protein VNM48_10820 [Chloroflexota bacterium]|nr:hypothetical protein [Chloroflexota bacterium]